MPKPIDRVVAHARTEPYFVAYWLDVYASGNGLDDARLCADLGCTRDDLEFLRLCRAPEPDSDDFRTGVTAIAHRLKIEPLKLAQILKSARVTVRLRETPPVESAFLVLAARDREDEPTPEEPA